RVYRWVSLGIVRQLPGKAANSPGIPEPCGRGRGRPPARCASMRDRGHTDWRRRRPGGPVEQARSGPPMPQASLSPETAPPPSILVVEDDASLAALLKGQLTRLGYQVDAIGDGRGVTAAVAAAPYDAILLDRMLPSVDGIDILKWLRGEGVETPV